VIKNLQYYIFSVLLCLLIFIADILTYLDFWILYVFPIFLILRTLNIVALYSILGLSTVLVGLGMFITATEVPFYTELENRIIGYSSEIIFVLIISRLIKTQKNLEIESRELKKRSQELAYSNNELEAFSYSVSHDLRLPIHAIKGFSEVLKEDYGTKLDESANEYISRIIVNAENANSLIDELLLLSKVSRQDLELSIVDLSNIAMQIEEDLKKMEPEREVEFSIQKGMVAKADKRLITIVLTNLINNAWKYTVKKEHAFIEFGKKILNGEEVFFIKDNGAGFDMQFADKLFRPFQRLHSSKEFQGTGVGLATVKRVINKHGGKVWGEGASGCGAVFYFTLPKTDVPR